MAPTSHAHEIGLAWRDPLAVFEPWAGTPNALLLHDGRQGRARIFVSPDAVMTGADRVSFDALAASARAGGGVWAGLFGYDLAADLAAAGHAAQGAR